MLCPNCRYEYVRGKTTCPDCGVALVEDLPPEPTDQPKDEESVVVYVSLTRLQSALVSSVLDGAGIEYVTTTDQPVIQHEYRLLFAVNQKDAARARELLLDVEEAQSLDWKDSELNNQ
jgi:hypothetical protein